MSSSSSALRPPAARVLRDGDAALDRPALLRLDLAPAGLARLDPDRIDAAVQEGHAAGFEAGYAEGFAAARAAGLAAAADEQAALTAALAERLAAVVRSAEAEITEALAGVSAIAEATARVTTTAAFSLAEAVVGRELALATHPGRDAVARALAISPEGAELTLRLNPGDAAALAVDGLPTSTAISVVPDPDIAPGDCVAEAGWTRIDARISTAMERVRAVLEPSA